MNDYIEIDNKINVKEGDIVDLWEDKALILKVLDESQDPRYSNICINCQHKNFCLKKEKYYIRFPKIKKIICMVPCEKNIKIYEEINNVKIPKEKMEHPIMPFITKFKNEQLLKYKNTFLKVVYHQGLESKCKKCFFYKGDGKCNALKHLTLACTNLTATQWAYEEVSEIEKMILFEKDKNDIL